MSLPSTLTLSLLSDGTMAILLEDGRNVRLPQDARGFAVMRKILNARAIAAEFDKPVGLATASSPIQYLVDKWVEGQDLKIGGVQDLADAGDF